MSETPPITTSSLGQITTEAKINQNKNHTANLGKTWEEVQRRFSNQTRELLDLQEERRITKGAPPLKNQNPTA